MNHKFTPPYGVQSSRMEYVDALRGFTMLLVVMMHEFVFSYDGWHLLDSSYNIVFSRFRMPLFFFISGFIYYKYGKTWNESACWEFLRKKALVQLLPTVVFLFAYMCCFDNLTTDA